MLKMAYWELGEKNTEMYTHSAHLSPIVPTSLLPFLVTNQTKSHPKQFLDKHLKIYEVSFCKAALKNVEEKGEHFYIYW